MRNKTFIFFILTIHFVINFQYNLFSESGVLNLPMIESHIAKWTSSGGSELGSSVPYIIDLCNLINVNPPDPSKPAYNDNTYIFEMPTIENNKMSGRIDLYKKGYFIWESKQGAKPNSEKDPLYRTGTAVRGTNSWDSAMLSAKKQAEGYAETLSSSEHPPFIIVSDIGYTIEVYSDFHNTGVYTPFPTARDNRIYLEDLRDENIRDRLKTIWTDPLSLDPCRKNAPVTTDIALKLSKLATSLERSNSIDEASLFIIRCSFLLFAEDCGIIPYGSFTKMVSENIETPDNFFVDVKKLWQHFNYSSMFSNTEPLMLTKEQLKLLSEAALADWSSVDTAIFGNMLEQALSKEERRKLGAHYTPHYYVQKLVVPTIIEPLRKEWNSAKERALSYVMKGDHQSAIREIENFHKELSELVILDPSSGSGNFLAVSLEMVKGLEGEVIQSLRRLGLSDRQIKYSVTPLQFKGIEINSRASTISELVVWITYLQNHYKIHGNVAPEMVLSSERFVENRDALLKCDSIKEIKNIDGTIKREYINPKESDPWPAARFIVGNPPFIGNNRMRGFLGDGYIEALYKVYKELPNNIDYVMYWWHLSAKLVVEEKVEGFGLITTSAISAKSNRKVVASFLENRTPLSIIMAIPNHPWISGGAQVRIAMTVGVKGNRDGVVYNVVSEKMEDRGYYTILSENDFGKIQSDLSVGVNVDKIKPLKSNSGLYHSGVSVAGDGFIITKEKAAELGLGRIKGLEKYIHPYLSGMDIATKSRNLMIIDLYGLSELDVKQKYPEVYQWLLKEVKPERDKNRNRRTKKNWWLFARTAAEYRKSISEFKYYIATPRTSVRHFFTLLDSNTILDGGVAVVASDDFYVLGILLSNIHREWILKMGGKLGNSSRYQANVFNTFPFPDASEKEKSKIRKITQNIYLYRNQIQKDSPNLTLSKIYNLIDKMDINEAELSEVDIEIVKRSGLDKLKKLHNDLDIEVVALYRWPTDLSSREVIERLFELNRERGDEESKGLVKWIRPKYQKKI